MEDRLLKILEAFQDSVGDDYIVSISSSTRGETLYKLKSNDISYIVTIAKLSDSELGQLKRLLAGLPDRIYPATVGLSGEKTRFFAELFMTIKVEKQVMIDGQEDSYEVFSPIWKVERNDEELRVSYYSDEAKGVLYKALNLSH